MPHLIFVLNHTRVDRILSLHILSLRVDNVKNTDINMCYFDIVLINLKISEKIEGIIRVQVRVLNLLFAGQIHPSFDHLNVLTYQT